MINVAKPDINTLMPEVEITASRSSGPGGQNVNKVNSRITLRFDITSSVALSEEQKAVLMDKLKSRITLEGVLVIHSQEGRSQMENRELAVKKLSFLISKAFEVRKARKRTKPTRTSKEERFKKKKIVSEKKKWRQKPL